MGALVERGQIECGAGHSEAQGYLRSPFHKGSQSLPKGDEVGEDWEKELGASDPHCCQETEPLFLTKAPFPNFRPQSLTRRPKSRAMTHPGNRPRLLAGAMEAASQGLGSSVNSSQ